MRAPLSGGAPKAPRKSNGQSTSRRALWIARMKAKNQERSEAKLAQYRTPKFAAKVERMTDGRAKEIARAIVAGGTVAEVTARLGVCLGTVHRTMQMLASGIHRSSPDNVRARTIAPRRLTRQEVRQGQQLEPWLNIPRPKLRAECKDGPRPCPFVSCRYHLYLDVNPETGSIKLNFPHWEVWEMKETCAMDVADRGGSTLEEAGELMNLTRERIRQVEVRGLLKLKQEGVALVGEARRVRAGSGYTAADEVDEENAKREPRHYRQWRQSRHYGNPDLVEKAMAQMPVGPQRETVLAIGKGELKPRKAGKRLGGLNYPQVFALLNSVLENRYRPPRDLPPRPPSRFATPEFAVKVKKVSWAKPKAKEIGRLAASGMHVDLIAREQNRPAQDILAVLWAIENGTPLPYLGEGSLTVRTGPDVQADTAAEKQLEELDQDELGSEATVGDLLDLGESAKPDWQEEFGKPGSSDAPAERSPRHRRPRRASAPGRNNEIVSAYQSGTPVTLLAAKYAVSREAIYLVLRKAGVQRAPRSVAPVAPEAQHLADGRFSLRVKEPKVTHLADGRFSIAIAEESADEE